MGTRLPPERSLARDLIVSRGTVSAAYDLLKSRGLLEAHERGATTVIGRSRYRSYIAHQAGRVEPGSGPLTHSLISEPGRMCDFAIAAVLPVPALARAGAALFASFLDEPIHQCGYLPAGLLSLRERIAEHYTHFGCPTSVDNILVTSGANQAVSLVLDLWVSPGDTVLYEDPSYPGVVDLLRASFARVHPIAIDHDGIPPTDLAAFVARGSPRLIMLSASFHNPTGIGVPVERRRAIAAVVARHDIPIIEDNASAETGLHDGFDDAPRTMSAFAPDAPIFSIGSVDKSLWTGLRVGWVRAPARFIARLQELKAISDMTTSLIGQRLAEQLFADPESLAFRRCELNARLTVLTRELGRAFPTWRWRRPDGGLVVWVDTGSENASRFAAAAGRYGLRLGVGSSFSVTNANIRFLRLTYSMPEETIIAGIRRMREAWDLLAL